MSLQMAKFHSLLWLIFHYVVYTHIYFIFACSMKKMFSFHSLMCNCPAFPAPLIDENVFSPLYILASYAIGYLITSVWVYFWALYSVSLIYLSIFVSVHHFDYCCFVVQSEVREHDSSSFVLFLSRLLWLFGVLGGSIRTLGLFCSSSVKNVMGILIGITLNLHTDLNIINILTILIFYSMNMGYLSIYPSSMSYTI